MTMKVSCNSLQGPAQDIITMGHNCSQHSNAESRANEGINQAETNKEEKSCKNNDDIQSLVFCCHCRQISLINYIINMQLY